MMKVIMGRRMWNMMRVTLLMIKKGLISRRKLIMHLNSTLKRGKLLLKYLSLRRNFITFHSRTTNMASGSFGIQEYEFSCSNSPNPVFFRLPKRKHHYFPCINPPQVIEEQQEEEESLDELLSPLSVRILNYLSEEEEYEENGNNGQVDLMAEQFIRRFYQQLKLQNRSIQLLQYPEN